MMKVPSDFWSGWVLHFHVGFKTNLCQPVATLLLITAGTRISTSNIATKHKVTFPRAPNERSTITYYNLVSNSKKNKQIT